MSARPWAGSFGRSKSGSILASLRQGAPFLPATDAAAEPAI
jgi:hypothetical protein